MNKNKKKKVTKPLKKSRHIEPHVQIISTAFDPRKGIKIELDWNEEFVEYLKKNGYTGSSDESIVQKWLGQLYGQLITDINPGKTSDFE